MASRMVAAPSSSVSLRPARMEQTVGEHVAALAVGGELDLVDGDEIGFEIERHRLDGADIEARARGLDLLLAGDERDLAPAPTRATILS